MGYDTKSFRIIAYFFKYMIIVRFICLAQENNFPYGCKNGARFQGSAVFAVDPYYLGTTILSKVQKLWDSL